MKKHKNLVIEENRCKGCQFCVKYCPREVLAIGTKINKLGYRFVVIEKPDACTACGICAEICPDIVIEVWKE